MPFALARRRSNPQTFYDPPSAVNETRLPSSNIPYFEQSFSSSYTSEDNPGSFLRPAVQTPLSPNTPRSPYTPFSYYESLMSPTPRDSMDPGRDSHHPQAPAPETSLASRMSQQDPPTAPPEKYPSTDIDSPHQNHDSRRNSDSFDRTPQHQVRVMQLIQAVKD